MRVDRRTVLAYRMASQGLGREGADAPELDVLDLGAQDTSSGSAATAMAIRLGQPAAGPVEDDRLATTWSFRGAPHVQRSEDLRRLAIALWPVSDDDALTRLDTSASPVRGSDLAPREVLRFIAQQLAQIVTEPMPKGEVSGQLTPRIPAVLTVDCRPCGSTHIVETLFRSAVLPAGIAFVPGERTVTFAPIPDWPGVPDDVEGLREVLLAYLHLHGPATLQGASAFLGARSRDLESHWPDGLSPVEVAGERRWIPGSSAELLRDPPDPPELRLLPPSDPFLQSRDRDLLVPDEQRRKALWPILGRPGAVLARGEIVGLWRARKKGRRLEVRIEAFEDLSRSVRAQVDDEAHLVALSRGATGASVGFDDEIGS